MRIEDAHKLARELVDKHVADAARWQVRFMHSRTTAGRCVQHPVRPYLQFSVNFIRHLSARQFKQVVLHEIAHAQVGAGHGHDEAWERAARRLGYTGERHVEKLPESTEPATVLGALTAVVVGTWFMSPVLGWIVLVLTVGALTLWTTRLVGDLARARSFSRPGHHKRSGRRRKV